MTDQQSEARSDKLGSSAEKSEAEEPFRLAGSIKILVSDEELEAGIAAERKRQAELFEAKMRKWFEN